MGPCEERQRGGEYIYSRLHAFIYIYTGCRFRGCFSCGVVFQGFLLLSGCSSHWRVFLVWLVCLVWWLVLLVGRFGVESSQLWRSLKYISVVFQVGFAGWWLACVRWLVGFCRWLVGLGWLVGWLHAPPSDRPIVGNGMPPSDRLLWGPGL